MRIDLHIHTNLSDGSFSPKEVIDESFKNRVSVISIADHDTIDAYTDELYAYAKEKKIDIIPAVEISTKIEKTTIHVLGYNFNLEDQKLKEALSVLKNARHKYLHHVTLKLKQLGYVLDVDKLDQIKSVTKAHIALDVISNPKNQERLLKNFGHIPNKGEFIEKTMNKGCPAYVKKETISPKEAAELIRNAGGKVVLAHPVAYKYESNLSDVEIKEIIDEMRADGIETNYIYIDKNNQKINEIEKWNTFAFHHHLFTTIGSDFHNKDGIHPEIGLLGETFFMNERDLDYTINFLKNKKDCS